MYVAMVVYGAKIPPLLAEDRPKWDAQQKDKKTSKDRRRAQRDGLLDEPLLRAADAGQETREDSHIFLPRVGELDMRQDSDFEVRAPLPSPRVQCRGCDPVTRAK